MKKISMLTYEGFITTVMLTPELDIILKERGVDDLVPHLPSVRAFYDDHLLPRLKKERKWKGCLRFKIIFCCITESSRKYSRKNLVDRLSVKPDDVVYDISLPVFEGEPSWYLPPMFWVRGLVLKA